MKALWLWVDTHQQPVAIALLVAVVTVLYGHTLYVPMYLDDHGAILNNHRLRDLPATLVQLFGQRGLTNLSFALNFRFTGWSLPPLHLTNIALHAVCSLLVWRLLRQLAAGQWLPLLGALLFAAHPLQTQAVTYLVQRAAVLAALLSVAAVLCHRQAQGALAAGNARATPGYWFWQGSAVLLCGAAILAKEHTVVLPLLLIAHDWLLPAWPGRSLRQRLLDYLPYSVVSLLVGGAVVHSLLGTTEVARITAAIATPAAVGPLTYLVTQFSVLWIYLRLLLIPCGQALEHAYPVVTKLLTVQNALALAGLLMLGRLVWQVRHRRPLLVFGAVWFVLGLVVESSIIPLDPLFEHRLYLPMVGCALMVLDGLPALLGARRATLLLALAVAACLPLTWRRNELWNDPRRFNEQNLRVAPASERVHQALIFDYRDAGRLEDAERLARQLLVLNPQAVVAYQELALLQATRDKDAEALAVIEDGLRRMPGEPGLYKTGAQLLMRAGQPQAALAFLQRGVAAAPGHAAMFDQLAALQFELGDLAAASQGYLQSLSLNGESAATRRNYAKLLYSQGRMAESLEQLRIALRLEPGNPDTWEGIGMSALALGDRKSAEAALAKLQNSDRQASQRVRAALTAAGSPEVNGR